MHEKKNFGETFFPTFVELRLCCGRLEQSVTPRMFMYSAEPLRDCNGRMPYNERMQQNRDNHAGDHMM